MRRGITTLCLLAGLMLTTLAGAARAQAPGGTAALPPWRVPDIASLPDDDTGRSIRYGRDLIQHSSALIGPDATDPAMRFAAAGLECGNCHLGAGTERYALPLVGIWGLYPTFSARAGKVQTMADRINDCMQRSMNGRPLPVGGREMTALLAYIRFLGQNQPAGVAPVGRGALPLPLPSRAADPNRGKRVYERSCAACHHSDGLGVRTTPADAQEQRRRYMFPPLWGPESYNDGAGMSRNITAAWFVHANMPRGITFAYPVLRPEQAYDVAAYINDQARPRLADLAKDYPDRWLKPADAAFPPLLGPFSRWQREFGPWPPIEAWLRAHRPHDEVNPYAAGEVEVTSASASAER